MTLQGPGIKAGAAAFALGLGLAVSSGAGIAAASPADSDSSSEASSVSRQVDDRADSKDQAERDTVDAETPSSETPDTAEAEAGDTEESDPGSAEDEVTEDEVTEDVPSPEGESTVDDGAVTDSPSDSPETASDNDEVGTSRDDEAKDNPSPAETTEAAQPVGDEESTAVDAAEDVPSEASPPAADVDTVSVVGEAADAPDAADVEAPELETAVLNAPSTGGASGLLGLLGLNGNSATPGPIASFVMALWDWTRRTFFNPGPTVGAATQYVQTVTGQVIGNIGATDPFGGRLRYTVVEGPKWGEVTIAEDGTFVYTPWRGRDTAAAPGTVQTDSFVVKVSQPGFHINLLNLFGNNGPARQTVNVGFHPGPVDGGGLESTTRGFDIYNTTSHPLKFYSQERGDVESGPFVGTVLQPGERVHFELTEYAFEVNETVLTFEGAYGYVFIRLNVPEGWLPESPFATCSSPSGGACAVSGRTVMVMDSPGTVVDIPDTQLQKQAELLSRLCDDSSVATCSFKATSYEETMGDAHPVGNRVKTGDQPASTTVSVSDTQQVQNSLKISAKEKVNFIVEAEVTEEYTWTWTKSHTFTQSVTVQLPPYYYGQVTARQPVYRVHGDFTLKMGNSTFVLQNVYFDVPNPDGLGEYDVETWPIPAEEIETQSVADSNEELEALV